MSGQMQAPPNGSHSTPSTVRPVTAEVVALPVAQEALQLTGEAIEDFWRRWSAWKGAAAPNTIRAMETGMRRFRDYAGASGVRMLPATPVAVVGFVRALEADGLKPATIDNRLSAVALLHKLAGLVPPTSDELVKLERKRVRKKLGTTQKQSAALRARGDIEGTAVGEDLRDAAPVGLCVATLCAAAGEVATVLAEQYRPMARRRRLVLLRDAAMLSIAYDGGLRASEVVRVREADLRSLPDGRATLTIGRSKTDQEGEGADVPVSRATSYLLAVWRHAARTEGRADALDHLFVRVTTTGFVLPSTPLRAVAVTDCFRRLATTAILRMKGGEPLTEAELANVASFSGHAARIGAAQDAVAMREDLAGIMQAYRWMSTRMPMRYTRRLNALDGSAARTQEALR